MNDQFGFGCMRLPLNEDGTVNYDAFKEMIDKYMAEGFTYFDTAHGYVQKQSETAIRDCLVARYPRSSYILTDKLSTHYFEKEEEIIPLFNHQLERTGVEYYDYYLMHAQDRHIYEKFKKCHAYEIGKKLKEEGKIKNPRENILVFQLVPDLLLDMFNPTEEFLVLGRSCLRTISWSFPIAAVCIILGASFQALGNGIYATITSLCRQMFALLPIAYLMSLTGNVNMVWLAYPLAEVVSGCVTGYFFLRIYRQKIKPLFQ